MIILGIDPGLSISGYGIIKKEKQKTYILDYGYVSLPTKKPIPIRIHQFYDFFTAKITEHCITNIAIETPFLGKNPQNFMKLGYLRGIVYLLSQQHTLALQEFSPREVKQAVTGYGGADKTQVARIVHRLVPGLQACKKQDITDALAVSMCGLFKSSQRVF